MNVTFGRAQSSSDGLSLVHAGRNYDARSFWREWRVLARTKTCISERHARVDHGKMTTWRIACYLLYYFMTRKKLVEVGRQESSIIKGYVNEIFTINVGWARTRQTHGIWGSHSDHCDAVWSDRSSLRFQKNCVHVHGRVLSQATSTYGGRNIRELLLDYMT
jgi:hypothetical protein